MEVSFYSLFLILNYPFLVLTIDEKLQNEMTLKSYGDCVVISWCENFDEQRQSIKGINGKEVNMEQLKAMGFWNDCQDYLRNMRKLRDAKVDREDLALLCFLCVLTGDRKLLKVTMIVFNMKI